MAHPPPNASNRILALNRAREEQKGQFERIQESLRAESQTGVRSLADAFIEAPVHHNIRPLTTTASDSNVLLPNKQQQQKHPTVGGLMTVEEYKAAQQNAKLTRVANAAASSSVLMNDGNNNQKSSNLSKRKAPIVVAAEAEETATETKPKKPKFNPNALSFVDEEDSFAPPLKIQKNKDVDTSFLPDKEREEMERQERLKQEEEWAAEQERIMNEVITVNYQYWDGATHKKTVECQRKNEIGQFLEKCRKQLALEFVACRSVGSSENMVCVIDDMIIPHTHSFYELQVREAKSFRSKQKLIPPGEICLGTVKVVTRSWFEKNKELFPASRWIMFDLSKHAKSA
eukprot:TRINITY_DN19241_c0_g1_i1.p2 TRINITY_DN19241_c0_g1~~TRINITY_DN19241_c0_g1_i1.p2  ORF type:complete len:344 (+),score=107.52 TRINITY_DN19241_c0_g1_i1:81-1112(+)